MIFFEQNIKPFEGNEGMNVSPISCELKDGRKGYYLGSDWKEEIESKGATTEPITKDDLLIEEL